MLESSGSNPLGDMDAWLSLGISYNKINTEAVCQKSPLKVFF